MISAASTATPALLTPTTVAFVGDIVFNTLMVTGGVVALLIIVGTIVYMLEDRE